jgi:hypothetical protein
MLSRSASCRDNLVMGIVYAFSHIAGVHDEACVIHKLLPIYPIMIRHDNGCIVSAEDVRGEGDRPHPCQCGMFPCRRNDWNERIVIVDNCAAPLEHLYNY